MSVCVRACVRACVCVCSRSEAFEVGWGECYETSFVKILLKNDIHPVIPKQVLFDANR